MSEWTPSTVMARYLEAADVERFFTADRPGTDRGYWPVFNPLVVDEVDRHGNLIVPEKVWTDIYDDTAREDYLQKWQGRGTADPGAVSRHDETLLWTCRIIKDEKVRRIVWVWSFCAVTPKRSFAKACRHYGWVRQTAYQRLTRAFEQISAKLNNDSVLLRYPADKWTRHAPQSDVDICHPIESAVSEKKPMAFIAEKSTHTLTTPEAVADFANYLADVNDQRRKLLARRFKQGKSAEASVDAA